MPSGTLASRRDVGLEAFNPACNQQQAETNDPRPGGNGCAQSDYAKLREQRNNKQHQGNHPYDEGWGFAGKIAHDVFLMGFGLKQIDCETAGLLFLAKGATSDTFTGWVATSLPCHSPARMRGQPRRSVTR